MDGIAHFDKGERWRSRAHQLRALAGTTDERAVRDNLLAMAAAFEQYALKCEGTALVFRFSPCPRDAARERLRAAAPEQAAF
jgi:hypothetical protein